MLAVCAGSARGGLPARAKPVAFSDPDASEPTHKDEVSWGLLWASEKASKLLEVAAGEAIGQLAAAAARNLLFFYGGANAKGDDAVSVSLAHSLLLKGVAASAELPSGAMATGEHQALLQALLEQSPVLSGLLLKAAR